MRSRTGFLFIAIGTLYLMVIFRYLYSLSLEYAFLIWNTFLAFIPYLISQKVAEKKYSIWVTIGLICLCVLFLPNALYIISDFEHFEIRKNVPYFYDIILMFYASLLGLLLNVLSIRNIEKSLSGFFKLHTVRIISLSIIFMSGFGVYLGRYLRWNSWDIFLQPASLARECMHRIMNPMDHFNTWAVSLAYAFILFFGYADSKWEI